MSNYKSISNFGKSMNNDPTTNPLSYCLLNTVDTGFLHGGTGLTVGNSKGSNCQKFMATYCAQNPKEWEKGGVCEFASMNTSVNEVANNLQNCNGPNVIPCHGLNYGEILIANTAARKYLLNTGGDCTLKWEQFDPTVSSSPFVSSFVGTCNNQGNNKCVFEYGVNPKDIDTDPVMTRILAKPIIAWGILVNIYNTAVRKNKLDELKGTMIYKFFMTKTFQDYISNMKALSGYLRNNTGCSSCR